MTQAPNRKGLHKKRKLMESSEDEEAVTKPAAAPSSCKQNLESPKHAMELDVNKSNSEEDLEVKEILDVRTAGGHGEYKIRWKGYDSSEDTWEPILNLNCADKIDEFWLKRGRGDDTQRKSSAIRKPMDACSSEAGDSEVTPDPQLPLLATVTPVLTSRVWVGDELSEKKHRGSGGFALGLGLELELGSG